MSKSRSISQKIATTSPILNPRRSLQLLLILVCLGSAVAMACPPWMRAHIAGGSGYTIPTAIKVAPNNDYYVTGQTIPNASLPATASTAYGGSDIFLAKFAASGKLIWSIQAGGPEDDKGAGLDIDSQGNVYVTGTFTDSAYFPSVDNSVAPLVTGLGQTIFLAKYTPAGNLVWVETGVVSYSGATNGGYGVAVDPAGSALYLTAVSQGNTTFSSQNGITGTVSGVGTWHMVVAKFDLAGDFQWAQTNESGPNSVPGAIAVDGRGSVYITGWLEDETTFSSTNGKDIAITGFSPAQINTDYPDDAFLVKYDSNGNAKWVNHIGGYKGMGNALAISPSGEITLVGFIGNVNYLSPSDAKTLATSHSPYKTFSLGGGYFTDPYNPDVVIATYDNAGQLKRAIRYGSSNDEVANGAAYDAKGNLYIVGLSRSGSAQPTLFVQKYSDSKLLWQQKAQNAGIWNEQGTTPTISLSPSGHIYVAGSFTGIAKFGTIDLSAIGSTDMFVAELAHE